MKRHTFLPDSPTGHGLKMFVAILHQLFEGKKNPTFILLHVVGSERKKKLILLHVVDIFFFIGFFDVVLHDNIDVEQVCANWSWR